MVQVALLLGLLAACQAPDPGDSPARPVPPGDYPDLAVVPPRPKLSYTVEQRRAIGNQLVADRTNARYRAAELAYATGATTEPPVRDEPPAPAASPAPPPAAVIGDPDIARAYVRSDLTIAADRGKLRQMMRRLEQPVPDPVGPATLAEAVGLSAPAPAAAGAGPQAAAQPDALERFSDFLGGALGLGDTAAAPVPAAEPATRAPALPLGSVVARLPLVAPGAVPGGEVDTQLGAALAQARVADAGLRIVGPSGGSGNGLEQARAVAEALLRQGARADELAVAADGTGDDEVLVYLAPLRAS